MTEAASSAAACGRCRRRRHGGRRRPPPPGHRPTRRRRRDAVRAAAVAADHGRRRRRRTAPRRGRRARPGSTGLTVVFVHGYALNLDCWHFQRAAYRGRSGRSSTTSAPTAGPAAPPTGTRPSSSSAATCAAVLDDVVADGPVVLVGHSMGGMTIVALAEEQPELFGDRVVGVGADLHDRRRARPQPDGRCRYVPRSLGGTLGLRTIATLARGHRGRRRRTPARPGRSRRSSPTSSRSATRCRPTTSSSSTRCWRRRRSRWWPSSSRASAPWTSSRPCEALGQIPHVGHLRHRRQADLDRPQPQAAVADPGVPAARVRGRRPHGDPASGTSRSTPSSTS